MKVSVTKADIENARNLRGDESIAYERKCPVACALSRMGFIADVCSHHVRFGSGDEVSLPEKAIDWISRYDHTTTLQINPFSFELRWKPLAERNGPPESKT